jgi:hypothetical protein
MLEHRGFNLKYQIFAWRLLQVKISVYMYCSIFVKYFT